MVYRWICGEGGQGGRPAKEPVLWSGETRSSSKLLGTGQGDGLPSQVIPILFLSLIRLKFELVIRAHGNKN